MRPRRRAAPIDHEPQEQSGEAQPRSGGFVLTEDDLIELTERERPTAQARVLDHMRIPYRPRLDGTLAVLRIHVETIEGYTPNARLPPEPQLVLDS